MPRDRTRFRECCVRLSRSLTFASGVLINGGVEPSGDIVERICGDELEADS